MFELEICIIRNLDLVTLTCYLIAIDYVFFIILIKCYVLILKATYVAIGSLENIVWLFEFSKNWDLKISTMWEIEINLVWDPQNLAFMIEPTLLQHNTVKI
jgi:hypothetical protein